MAKGPDPVKLAKLIAERTKLPLPNVAQIMQKYPLDADGGKKALDECEKAAAVLLKKDLKAMFNI